MSHTNATAQRGQIANNEVSTWHCIQDQKVRLGSLEQLDLQEELATRAIKVTEVSQERQEQLVQLDQLAARHCRVHLAHLDLKVIVVLKVEQVNSTRVYRNAFIKETNEMCQHGDIKLNCIVSYTIIRGTDPGGLGGLAPENV